MKKLFFIPLSALEIFVSTSAHNQFYLNGPIQENHWGYKSAQFVVATLPLNHHLPLSVRRFDVCWEVAYETIKEVSEHDLPRNARGDEMWLYITQRANKLELGME